MPYNPNIHHRRSIRLKGYDYTKAGLYFITLVCKNRAHLFGKIINQNMVLNELGEIADREWEITETIKKNIILHEYIIMPNHMHGIIEIIDDMDEDDPGSTGVLQYAPTEIHQADTGKMKDEQATSKGLRSPSKSIGAIIRGYKGVVTKQINIKRKTPKKPIWQRNYWEHIIRDASAYHRIANYIQTNPRNWKEDTFISKS